MEKSTKSKISSVFSKIVKAMKSEVASKSVRAYYSFIKGFYDTAEKATLTITAAVEAEVPAIEALEPAVTNVIKAIKKAGKIMEDEMPSSDIFGARA